VNEHETTDLEYREAAMRLAIQSFGTERATVPYAFVQRAKYFEVYLRTGE
jgi:hypothetical protein